jgi:hypothetical protein
MARKAENNGEGTHSRQVECEHCGAIVSRQGYLGHMRLAHGDQSKKPPRSVRPRMPAGTGGENKNMGGTMELGPDTLNALETLTQRIGFLEKKLYKIRDEPPEEALDLRTEYLRAEEDLDRTRALLAKAQQDPALKEKGLLDGDWFPDEDEEAEEEERREAAAARVEKLQALVAHLGRERDELFGQLSEEVEAATPKKRGRPRKIPADEDAGEDE